MDAGLLRQCLFDAGCSDATARDIVKVFEAGDRQAVLRMMKKGRCALMDELHESGRKVDCLDFLIRSLEKEMKAEE